MQVYPIVVAAALLAAGCSAPEQAGEGEQQPRTIHAYMTQRIDPDADAIWAIGNAAMSDDASIDPAKMTPETWRALARAADRMTAHAQGLAALDPVRVTEAGTKIADEGTEGAPTPAQIEAHLKQDTDVFRALGGSLTTHAQDLAAAAKARDAATAGRLISEMDGVCESCHLEFWYPEQRELMEKMGLLPD